LPVASETLNLPICPPLPSAPFFPILLGFYYRKSINLGRKKC
jgi:hypothetical protein